MTTTPTPAISGAIEVRPARLGIILDATAEQLETAVRYCSRSWGGIYTILFPSDTSSRDLARLADRTGIDAVWPMNVGKSQQLPDELVDYRWNAISPANPFDSSLASYGYGMLGTKWLLPSLDSAPTYGEIPEAHPLGLLLTTLVGLLDASSPELFEYAHPIRCDSPIALNELIRSNNPLRVGGLETSYATPDYRRGLFVLDPSNITHLIDFWNLRAQGVDLFPFPMGHSTQVLETARYWLASWRNPLLRPFSALHFETLRAQGISVWNACEPATIPPEVEQLAEEAQLTCRSAIRMHPPHYSGISPIRTRFGQPFHVGIGSRYSRLQASIPLPQIHPAFTDTRGTHGVVAADIDIRSEDNPPRGATIRIPGLRKLSQITRTFHNLGEPFQRPVNGGQSVGVVSSTDAITIHYVPTLAALTVLGESAGWTLSQSDNGRFGEEIDRRLGNCKSEVSNEPAVRQVLWELINAQSPKPFAALSGVAYAAREGWPRAVYAGTARDYANGVVHRLLSTQLIHPSMQVKCLTCSNTLTASPEQLATSMQCQMCDSTFPLGLAIAINRNEDRWRYRLAPDIQVGKLSESLAVIATQSVLSSLSNGSISTCFHALGVQIKSPRNECEIDVVASVSRGEPLPTLVLGEVKSRRDEITQTDIDNIERARSAIASGGLPSIGLFACLRKTFTETETAILRLYCEQLSADSSTQPATLPLVLTFNELSTSWFDPPHPCQWVDPSQKLAEISRESCRRNLGVEL